MICITSLNISGNAHKDGITFVGPTHTVTIRLIRGAYDKKVIKNNSPINESNLFWYLAKVPLLRGWVDIIYGFFVDWRSSLNLLFASVLIIYSIGYGLKEIETLLPVHIAPIVLLALLSVYLLLLLIFQLNPIGRSYARFHAAEHMANNSYLKNNEVNVAFAARSSRIHIDCGTNILLLLIVFSCILSAIEIPFWLKIIIWFTALGEIRNAQSVFAKVIIFPLTLAGQLLQLITTAKPTNKELELAVSCINDLLEREATSEDPGEDPGGRFLRIDL